MDTTRADYLSCYGSGKGDTPNLDAIGADGVRFDMALSASSVTPVSHATILTGEYPYNHGLRVLFAKGGYRLKKDSLASTFKGAGYRTLAVHSSFAVSDAFGFSRDFDVFENFEGEFKPVKNSKDGVGWDVKTLQRRSDETTDMALDALDADDDPFFMWMHYWDPHDPVLKPPMELIEDIRWNPESGPFEDRQPIPADWDRFYAREVNYLDTQIGRLIEGLKERGLYENTIIVITADHGEGLTDGLARHDWPSHRHVYQEQLHVPLLMRAPEMPAGVVVDSVASTVDIAPTILDLAGLEAPEVDGVSLSPHWRGDAPGQRYVYADQINGYDINAMATRKDGRTDMDFLFMISDGEWKAVYRPNEGEKGDQLFHLTADPLETKNVKTENLDVWHRLLGDLAIRNPWVLAPFPEDQGAPDISGQMGALGYGQGTELSDVDWSWTCPRHRSYRAEVRGRHKEERVDCDDILILVKKD